MRGSQFEKDTSYGSEIVFDESPRIDRLKVGNPKQQHESALALDAV